MDSTITESNPPTIDQLEEELEEMRDTLMLLRWETEDLSADVDALEGLLRRIRQMLRSKSPDLEYAQILIDREIGSL